MTRLTRSEIKAGVVSWLDQEMMLRDKGIQKKYSIQAEGIRPFLCVEANQFRSAWIPLTSHYKKWRIKINSCWRIGGSKSWRQKDGYLAYSNVLIGPNESFIYASHSERKTSATRAMITEEGLSSIRIAIVSNTNIFI